MKIRISMFALVVAAACLTGCAGLMMNVSDVDASRASLVVSGGDAVAIDEARIAKSFASAGAPPTESAALAARLAFHLRQKLSEGGVAVDAKAPRSLDVEITHFDRGCGVCRGLLPVFGLGDSYLDGKVTLRTPEGSRTLKVEKTGQTKGVNAMGDQSETNMDYFATVVASHLVAPSGGNSEGGKS